MARRERRRFSDEYKAEVVALVRSSGKTVGAISRDLDLTETAVRDWDRMDHVRSMRAGNGRKGASDRCGMCASRRLSNPLAAC
jgi:transposase